ncbi:MAG: hypothetical protein KGM99_06300 [Burkholderiales bacterium]|nr:hypothetical protein [Burkholderiales bacterium]
MKPFFIFPSLRRCRAWLNSLATVTLGVLAILLMSLILLGGNTSVSVHHLFVSHSGAYSSEIQDWDAFCEHCELSVSLGRDTFELKAQFDLHGYFRLYYYRSGSWSLPVPEGRALSAFIWADSAGHSRTLADASEHHAADVIFN